MTGRIGERVVEPGAPRVRIAVVSSHTPSLVNFRFQLLQALMQNGHEVIALGPEDHRPTIETLASIGVSFRRFPLARAGLNPFQDLRTLASLFWTFMKLRPNVVIAYTMKPIIYGLLAARFARVHERHALITGLGYVFSGKPNDLGLLRRFSIHAYRAALAGTGRVFVYNEADDADLRAAHIVADGSRIVEVPGSGVDLQRFRPAPVPQGGPVFLMISRLLREKGVAEFVAAARMLRKANQGARFCLLGPFDPGPLGIAVEDMQEWIAEGDIEYFGETDDVRPFLADSSVFVLPTYYREGIPRSILEALATARAIITTNMPGCRETVSHGGNGFLVPPRDAVALADAMQRFIDDSGLATHMGRRSLEIAHKRFDAREIAHRLLQEMDLLAPADIVQGSHDLSRSRADAAGASVRR